MEKEGRRFRAAAAPIDLRTNDTMERYSVARSSDSRSLVCLHRLRHHRRVLISLAENMRAPLRYILPGEK